MGVTKFDNVNATNVGAKYVAALPTTPSGYYDIASNDVDSVSWQGGEMCFNSSDNRLYVQVATSGTSSTWKRLLETFATSTTSTSTSSSTSTSTSTSSTTTSA